MKLKRIFKSPIVYLAILAAKLGQWSLAMNIMQRYLSTKQNAKASDHYRLAVYASRSGYTDVAINQLAQALKIVPENKHYITLLSSLLKLKFEKLKTRIQKDKFIKAIGLPNTAQKRLKKCLHPVNGYFLTKTITSENNHLATVKLKQSKQAVTFNVVLKLLEQAKIDDVAKLSINSTDIAQVPILQGSLARDGTTQVKVKFKLHGAVIKAIFPKHTLRLSINGEEFYLTPILSYVDTISTWFQSKIKVDLSNDLDMKKVLNKKGLLIVAKDTNLAWIQSTLKHYTFARKVFDELFGLDLHVVGGTLLGYAREGGFIGFDKDFDSAYISSHSTTIDIQAEFKNIIITLLSRGEDIRLVTRVGKKVRCDYFMWFSPSGHHIDVFPAAFYGGGYRRPTFVQTNLQPKDFFPMTTALFHGYEILVPKNYEKKVEAVYGENWRSPDPFWKKIKTPEMIAYRKKIMLQEQDLLEIAALSSREGAYIAQVISQGELRVQY